MGNLASAVDELAGADLFALPVRTVGEEILALLAERDRLDAQITRRVGHFDRHAGPSLDAASSTGAWLVGHGRLSRGEAFGKVDAAQTFARGDLPATAAAYADGRVGFDHVRTIVRGVRGLPAEVVTQAEATLVESAERLDPAKLRIVVDYFRHRIDADRFAKDSAARDESRGVDAATILDGVVALRGTLTPLCGAALLTYLDAAAQKCGPDDTRTAAQRRHDALYDLLRQGLDSDTLPEMGGAKPHLVIHVQEETLHAARRYGGGTLAGDALRGVEAATLERTGALLDLATLCQLAGDAALSRVLLRGPTEILDLYRKARTATAAQRIALAVRDRGCIVPGCGRPPRWCEVHHIIAWDHDGLTNLDNLCLLCRYHHGLMSRGWHVAGTPGHFTIHRPDGSEVRGPPASAHLLS